MPYRCICNNVLAKEYLKIYKTNFVDINIKVTSFDKADVIENISFDFIILYRIFTI